jgi:hypothetical protein
MSKQKRETERTETQLDLSHLRRETRTALELGVVAMAPQDLLDRLAAAAGLLEAIDELPVDINPVAALVPKLAKRSRAALDDWQSWQAEHLRRAKA